MQSPASSIQSPRPQGRPPTQAQVPFDKELMASLHVLLNQLGEVERQGLVMFHKIEESFKHPYTQQEAISDTSNLLTQLDALSTQAKTTGFSALTMLPTSPTVISTPSANYSNGGITGTPKPSFMSPRMQNHIHNNLHTMHGSTSSNNTHYNNNVSSSGSGNRDISMMSPGGPLSLVSTPAGSTPLPGLDAASGSIAPTPTATESAVATPAAGATSSAMTAPSPFPSSDIIMSSSTPVASGLDPTTPVGATTTGTATAAATGTLPSTTIGAGATGATAIDLLVSTPMNPATPATPSANASTVNPSVALAQMMDARQKDVNALFAEKRKLRSNFKIAAQMTKV